MKNETELWVNYGEENYKSALILLDSHLYNPTLQNIQQSIEKYLKAICLENDLKIQKTHSISSLVETLKQTSLKLSISDDDIDLIDSIYISLKYPLGSVLPDFTPDEAICKNCLDILQLLKKDCEEFLSQ